MDTLPETRYSSAMFERGFVCGADKSSTIENERDRPWNSFCGGAAVQSNVSGAYPQLKKGTLMFAASSVSRKFLKSAVAGFLTLAAGCAGLPTFGADLGKQEVAGQEVRAPYTSVISY
jgi:hypothetical protein